MRTGTSNLPLHYGQAPAWLFKRMVSLGREITFAILQEFDTKTLLRKISNPYWFQALGCVLGFDWHSSGLTTTTCGALKEGLRGIDKDLGIFICGGKGNVSRKTPQEIKEKSESIFSQDKTSSLVYASRMSAKVDSSALQDGYQIYHHTFFFDKRGAWAVVQQGMNEKTKMARRYHWLSDDVVDFVVEPESAICSDAKGPVLNMVAEESEKSRLATTEISKNRPEKTIKILKRLQELSLPRHHELFLRDINPDSIRKALLTTYEGNSVNFEKLLSLQGVGPKTIRALALISEILYKSPASRFDPATYSFAHGGKDGFPYPVDRKNYDDSIKFLKNALKKAKIGNREKIESFKRLSLF